MAAEIWSTKLGELFAEENDPERVRSAPYRRRQNSLDEESVTSDMSSKQTKRSRRIHSAEAAVTLLRHLLKGMRIAVIVEDFRDRQGVWEGPAEANVLSIRALMAFITMFKDKG